jgi:hypothetical protein
MYIELTAADHEANGFVNLARWHISDVDAGRAILDLIDEGIPDEAAGDMKVDPYNFILDLHEEPDTMIDNNKKPLPLQMAMRLAPEQVSAWMSDRPDPDSVAHIWPPFLDGTPNLEN